jgi:hypothetical protein
MRILGTNVIVLPVEYQTTNEAKQSGLYFDVEETLELRVGDTLQVFIELN